jgi:hypothetical protein
VATKRVDWVTLFLKEIEMKWAIQISGWEDPKNGTDFGMGDGYT